MDLIFHFLKVYSKIKFGTSRNFFLLVGMIVWAVLQALVWSISTTYFSQTGDIKYMKFALLTSLSFCTLFRTIIPFYTPLMNLVNPIYPINRMRSYLIENAKDWLSFYFIAVITFLLFLPLFSNEFDYLFSAKLILVCFSFNIIRRIIQSFLEKKIRASARQLIPFFFSLLMLISTELAFPFYSSPLVGDALKLVLLFIIGVQTEYYLTVFDPSQFSLTNGKGKVLRSLFFRNRKLLQPFFAGLIMKISFLVLDAVYLHLRGIHFFELGDVISPFFSKILLAIYIYPVFIFNIFNNIWGYYRNLFLTVRLRTDTAWVLFLWRIKLIAIPLGIDLLVTLCYGFFSKDFHVYSLMQYAIYGLLLVSTGFYFSFRFPDDISRKKIMKSGSPIMVNLLNLVLLWLFLTIEQMGNSMSLLIEVISVVCIFYYSIKQGFKMYTNENVYLKLFKR